MPLPLSHNEGEEYNLRRNVFEQNMETARALSQNDRASGEYGATKFMDLTQEEFRAMYLNEPVNGDTLTRSCLSHGVSDDFLTRSGQP